MQRFWSRGMGFALVLVAAMLTTQDSCSGQNGVQQPRMAAGDTPGIARTYPHYASRAVRVRRDRMTIDDGDTFVYEGVTVRILGIDTPEIMHPEHGFFEDQEYGRAATDTAIKVFDQAGIIEYVADSLDPYGRTLGQVFIDGESFAVRMIQSHMAYESVSFYGDNGFPDIARLILEAAGKAGRPPFQEPHLWRQEHRKEPAPASH